MTYQHAGTVQNLAWWPRKVDGSVLNIRCADTAVHCVPVHMNVWGFRKPNHIPPASLLTSRKHSAFPTGDTKWNELFLSTMPCISTGNFISRGNEHCRAGGGISGYVETMSSALRRAVPFILYHHHVHKRYINFWLYKWPNESNIRNLVRWLCEPEWTILTANSRNW
jgi:hypothetical protein